MGTGKITRQEHSEDERRRDEIEEGFAPRSMRRFSADPSVKPLRNTELVVVDDGTARYLAFRLDGDLFKVLATASGDFVKVEGDTMSGQLTSTVASGAPPYVVASTDVVDNLNVDQVDGFDLDQSLLTTDSPEFVALTLSSLTASRLIATDGSKVLVSVSALTAWVTGTVNQITITDDGDGTITISAPQDIHTGASPEFTGLTLSGLTASRLMATDGSKAADSVAALSSWIAGTVNQITVADDGDGTITLSLPQDIHTGASPEFTGLTLSSLTASRLSATDGSKALESVADLTNWVAGTAGQVAVTDDGDGTITLAFTSGRILNVSRYTTTQTLGTSDHHVAGDTDGGAFTITLPAGVAGTEYKIANTGTSANDLTIAPDGAELLIGVNDNFTLADGEALNITYEATEGWF